MTARVDILVGERRDVVRLPINAVFERDDRTAINVLRGGRIEPRLVELGEQNRRFVEVLAGVTQGEHVLLAGDVPAIEDGGEASGSLEALAVDFGDLLGEDGDARLGSMR